MSNANADADADADAMVTAIALPILLYRRAKNCIYWDTWRTPEITAVIILKFEQYGISIGPKIGKETGITNCIDPDQTAPLRSSMIWVYTVFPQQSVWKQNHYRGMVGGGFYTYFEVTESDDRHVTWDVSSMWCFLVSHFSMILRRRILASMRSPWHSSSNTSSIIDSITPSSNSWGLK